MHHAKRGIALLLTLVAVAGLAACGSDDDETTSATTTPGATTQKSTIADGGEQFREGGKESIPTIVVRNGEPLGGIAELEYDAGEQVRFRVSSNVADEVHVHGYDASEEIPAGGLATLSFPADIEGIFEVELHGSEKQIAELRVNP
jgi:ABC-type glycerol-3-phosphate transport system substrate-binding protein